MFGIKLYNTYNKLKHILIKPKLKVMFGPMEHQPFFFPPFRFSLFNKHKCLNRDTFEYEYDATFLAKIRRLLPNFPLKVIFITLPNWMTFKVMNKDFGRKWKYNNPRFEQKGYFSIVFFGIALTFYLEIPLDNEERFHEDEYYEFMMEYLNGPNAGDIKEAIKNMGTVTQHTTKYGKRKYHGFWKEWLKPEWHATYDIAIKEMKENTNTEKKEWILCSAIKRKEPRKECTPYWPGTNDICNIELGYRHHDIFHRFEGELSESEQGFYTSKGRFVDRKEAAKIAYAAGQISSPTNKLFSEDLY